MPNNFTDTLNVKNNRVDFDLTLIGFEEDNQFIFYSPALELYAYGDDQEDAKQSFGETVELYFDFVLSENTFERDWLKLGWRRDPYIKFKFVSPLYNARNIMSTT